MAMKPMRINEHTCEDENMLEILSQAYSLFYTTNNFPGNLSADELLAELPEGADYQRQSEWLKSFIDLWDAS